MKFDGLDKKEFFVDRKKYVFYVKSRKGFGYNGYMSSNTTIYVDEEDNIINIFPGRFVYLDEDVLTIKDDDGDHNSYYNINTGELMMTEYDKVGRCYTEFKNGIALVYDDKINNYHIMTVKGEIGDCNWLYRIGKKSLLVHKNRLDETLSLYDYNMNLIKKDVSLKYDNIAVNNECFVCCEKDGKKDRYYYLCDYKGNIISDKFLEIKAEDRRNMQEIVAVERDTKRKMTVHYSELIKK